MARKHTWTVKETEQMKNCLEQGMGLQSVRQQVAFADIAPGAVKSKWDQVKRQRKFEPTKVIPNDKSNHSYAHAVFF
jgi:hypothetical protein